MTWYRRLIPWWPLLAVVLVFALGVLGGRAWFPKTVIERVDREIVRVVERLIPGETRTIVREVPGGTTVIRVPVEVTRVVEVVREVPVERIVTITKPVDVPVEVIRREWPQAITVRVGGVLSLGQWHIPDHPDLTIGQVSPGVYAVSGQMTGWRVHDVTTTTTITPVQVAKPSLPYHLGVTFGFLDDRLYSGVTYTNRLGPGYYSAIVGYGFPGVVVGASFTLPIR